MRYSSGFRIKSYDRADPIVISDVNLLMEEAASIEGIKSEILPETSMNFRDGMPCLFTCEYNQKLIGVLNVFAPGPYEAEIGALVHPDYRRHGVFKALLSEALYGLSKYGYRRGLMVADASLDSGDRIADHWGLPFDHGEYHMSRLIEELRIYEGSDDILITEADDTDLDEMTSLGTLVFEIDEISERQLLLRTLNSANRVQWTLKKGGRIIGICGIRLKDNDCMVFGLGIHPKERRRGYARDLLAFIAGYAEKRGAVTLSLDVDSENAPAILLYEGFGLRRKLETNYYNFNFRKLRKFLRPRR
jgi:ribosomal protein S18 acetylase RimI-like enzyme